MFTVLFTILLTVFALPERADAGSAPAITAQSRGGTTAGKSFYSGAEMIERSWQIACGPKRLIPKYNEILEIRRRFQSFLQKPQIEAERMLAEDDESERAAKGGAFNLQLMCGSVNRFEKRLRGEYCLTDRNRKIDAEQAIAYCRTIEEEVRRIPQPTN